jgi:hypothetical protein
MSNELFVYIVTDAHEGRLEVIEEKGDYSQQKKECNRIT